MRRRIRRQSPLTQQTRTHAENLLTVSVPPEMQAVLAQLQDNLHNVNQLIDQQLRQTRALNVQAYHQLNTSDAAANPTAVATPQDSNSNSNSSTSPPAAPSTLTATIDARQHVLNQQISEKIASLTAQIAARTQQVSAQAEQVYQDTQQASNNTAEHHD